MQHFSKNVILKFWSFAIIYKNLMFFFTTEYLDDLLNTMYD